MQNDGYQQAAETIRSLRAEIECAESGMGFARRALTEGDAIVTQRRLAIEAVAMRDFEYEQDVIASQCERGGWDYRGN